MAKPTPEEAIIQHQQSVVHMHEVTEDVFFKRINTGNNHPTPVGPYPHQSEWKNLTSGAMIGRSIPVKPHSIEQRYFLVRKPQE